MKLAIKKMINDGFIILCRMLRSNVPRIGDHKYKIIPYAKVLSLSCKSGMALTELITQHVLISQKLLQYKDDYGPGVLYKRFLKISRDCEL